MTSPIRESLAFDRRQRLREQLADDARYGHGSCKTCGHGVRSHSPRSGTCGIEGCKCAVFDGPGTQPWEVEFQDEARESISVYAARASTERDVAVNALTQIVAEFDGHETDPVLHIARAALRQIKSQGPQA